MRYDAEHKAKTRERVLIEAAKAIREEGPDRVAVAGLMAKAGLTHGGFYAHFKSKDDLVAAAIEEMFSDAAKRFARSTEGYSPEEGMIRYIDFYLSEAHRDNRGSGCPITALATDLPRLEAEPRERYGRGVAGLTAKVAGQLQKLGRADPEGEAPSIVAELVGALSLARAVSDSRQSAGVLSASRTALKHRLGLETQS
jgi:TetR/AcrR family transcriptional regulator, transcriptional repressor for nem operon